MKKFDFFKKTALDENAFSESEFIPPEKPYKLRLQELRKKAKLNQTEAGQIVCTSQKQYSRWETGAFDIPIFELSVFAIYYNCKVDYLLGLTDDDSPLYSEEERKERIKAMKISRYFNRFGMWEDVPSGKEIMEKSRRQ